MSALKMVRPCRKCGSDDIALYQLKNADYICRSCKKDQSKQLYLSNRELYIERSKKDYESNKKPYGSRAWAGVILAQLRYRDKQKLRHPICDITHEQLLKIIKEPCFYCDDVIDKRLVDRIDNNVGHTLNNVVSSCYPCNATRMDNWSHVEMKAIGKTIKQIKEIRRAK